MNFIHKMMDKNSKSKQPTEQDFLALVSTAQAQGLLTPKVANLLLGFYHSYKNALMSHQREITDYLPLFYNYLEKVKEFSNHPYPFEPYHKKVTAPFDFFQFGIDFLKPLVFMEDSYLLGEKNVYAIKEHLLKGHNVVFLSNHQIEPDPQALCILLEPYGREIIDALIFIAGERVVTDPIAIPFSIGCNLLCIYSKRYVDHPPEKKGEKLSHNSKTMKMMKALLDEGGKAIYVAPSGGRDRKDSMGTIRPALFDPQSVEMFHLIARQSKKATFFYPLALSTYSILPPPDTIQKELGEQRTATASAIKIAIGEQINMDDFAGSELQDKEQRRAAKAHYIYTLVCQEYDKLL